MRLVDVDHALLKTDGDADCSEPLHQPGLKGRVPNALRTSPQERNYHNTLDPMDIAELTNTSRM